MAAAVKIGTPTPPVAFDALLTERLNALYLRKLEPVDAVPTPWPLWNTHCGGDGGKQGLSRGWHVIAGARTGTNYSTLRRIYDDVTVEDMREAWSEAQRKAQ